MAETPSQNEIEGVVITGELEHSWQIEVYTSCCTMKERSDIGCKEGQIPSVHGGGV